MPRKPVSQMTPEEAEEYRAYMRAAKARSRAKMPEGTCLSCGGSALFRNGRYLSVCAKCETRSREHDKARGYPMRPSVFLKRQAISMAKDDMEVDEIARLLRADKAQVQFILERAGLL